MLDLPAKTVGTSFSLARSSWQAEFGNNSVTFRVPKCDLTGVGAPEVFGNAAHSESLEQERRIRLLRNGASHSALHGAQQTDMPVTPVASIRRRRSDDYAGE
jgi:hypothetical protein